MIDFLWTNLPGADGLMKLQIPLESPVEMEREEEKTAEGAFQKSKREGKLQERNGSRKKRQGQREEGA